METAVSSVGGFALAILSEPGETAELRDELGKYDVSTIVYSDSGSRFDRKRSGRLLTDEHVIRGDMDDLGGVRDGVTAYKVDILQQ